jgi:glycerophosphoryl diester phosphodiesterase
VDNPWLSRRVLCFAHQAGAKEAPSSTLYAIERALQGGADVIELDLHCSADGVLICCHDETLDATTEASGLIAQHTASEITALDAAYHFVPGLGASSEAPAQDCVYRGLAASDARFRPVPLEAVLEGFPAVALNLDLKRTAPEVRPYEAELARVLRAHGRVDDVIVTSFFDQATEAFRALAPEIGTSAGTNALTGFVQAVRGGNQPDPSIRRHVALQLPAYYAGVRLVDEALIDAAHRHGLAIHVWTVDEEEEMERLVEEGADGIMSDLPSLLGTTLRRLGANYRS